MACEPMYITQLQSMPDVEPLYITMRDGLVRAAARGIYTEKVETVYTPKLYFSSGGTATDSDSTATPRKSGSSRGASVSSSSSSDGISACNSSVSRLDERAGRSMDLARKLGPPPGLEMFGAPRLLWCEGNADKRTEQTKALKERFCHSSFSHFGSPSNFTRWLFEQGAGSVIESSAVLVVGWREAKPCGAAITAAITGNTDGLRKDCKRPELWEAGRDSNVVKAMIIIPESQKHIKRAADWIQSESALRQGVDLQLALDPSQLVNVLDKYLPYAVANPATAHAR
eukprot:gb/GFBE01063734.1/.p1 GENE.gb/GFBE01063734.1/~~gb/GFBE01063734.1/.p1  ORF type:complete len:285 (+),score=48.59 gb/GFBE01063734.1/:1-855(+)